MEKSANKRATLVEYTRERFRNGRPAAANDACTGRGGTQAPDDGDHTEVMRSRAELNDPTDELLDNDNVACTGRGGTQAPDDGDHVGARDDASQERSEAQYEEMLIARTNRWKSKICRNMQLRKRQGEQGSRFNWSNFKKRERVRRIKARNLLDTIGLNEVSTKAFAEAENTSDECSQKSKRDRQR